MQQPKQRFIGMRQAIIYQELGPEPEPEPGRRAIRDEAYLMHLLSGTGIDNPDVTSIIWGYTVCQSCEKNIKKDGVTLIRCSECGVYTDPYSDDDDDDDDDDDSGSDFELDDDGEFERREYKPINPFVIDSEPGTITSNNEKHRLETVEGLCKFIINNNVKISVEEIIDCLVEYGVFPNAKGLIEIVKGALKKSLEELNNREDIRERLLKISSVIDDRAPDDKKKNPPQIDVKDPPPDAMQDSPPEDDDSNNEALPDDTQDPPPNAMQDSSSKKVDDFLNNLGIKPPKVGFEHSEDISTFTKEFGLETIETITPVLDHMKGLIDKNREIVDIWDWYMNTTNDCVSDDSPLNLSLIHISEPTRPAPLSRMPSSA